LGRHVERRRFLPVLWSRNGIMCVFLRGVRRFDGGRVHGDANIYVRRGIKGECVLHFSTTPVLNYVVVYLRLSDFYQRCPWKPCHRSR
jgi:hypothetical protein